MRILALVLLAACARPQPAPVPVPVPLPDLAAAAVPLTPPDALSKFDWSPETAKSPASTVFANAQVMGTIRADRFMQVMFAMKPALGVECSHCHLDNAFPSDEKDPKLMARRMLLLARHTNDLGFRGETRVSCWTCHRGETKPPTAPEGFGEKLGAMPLPEAFQLPEPQMKQRANKVFKNLQLVGGRFPPGVAKVMQAFTISLGVDCSHCHVGGGDFASDAKPAKQRAREMMRMAGAINGELGVRGAVSCWTCHRGQPVPPPLAGPAH